MIIRNPNQVAAQNTRARKSGVTGLLERDEWEALCERYNNRCLCCKEEKPLAIDHVIPFSQGGTNTIDNVQPLCRKCNSTKYNSRIDYRNSER